MAGHSWSCKSVSETKVFDMNEFFSLVASTRRGKYALCCETML